MLYAIHDARVRPYPGHKMGPSLAESWMESSDGKTYELCRVEGKETARFVYDRGRQLGKRRHPGGGFHPAQYVYAYGGYPDIDELFKQQRDERDRKIQQLTIDRVMYAPVMGLCTLTGIGPRKHTITDIRMSPFPSYEDIELKN